MGNRRYPRGWIVSVTTIFAVVVLGLVIYWRDPVPPRSLRKPPPFDGDWTDKSGSARTLDELKDILQKHQLWLSSEPKTKREGQQADLSDSILWTINLNGTRLRQANLSGANLTGVDLSNADLEAADLSQALISSLTTQDPSPNQGEILTFGPKQNFRTLFVGASLRSANLAGAVVFGADLKDADFDGANMSGAVFEPYSLPSISLAGAKGLELMTYSRNPTALVRLRKEFQDQGLLDQERKITYALKRREAQILLLACSPWADLQWPLKTSETDAASLVKRGRFDLLVVNCLNYSFNRVFFDLTSQYGMTPGRPLRLLAALWLICAGIYYFLIRFSRRSAILVIPSKHTEIEGDEDKNNGRRIRRIQKVGRMQARQRSLSEWLRYEKDRRTTQSSIALAVAVGRRWFRSKWRRARSAMFFSLMSAFNIGFRDIDFGRWLRLLTKRQYDLKPVGWARTVAGWQSLISLYLVALWILTYFGRPFE